MKSNNTNINGIIVINKERGFTSHDVVAKMRRILNTKKIGHTGTLDPEATGVLPICIGKATRVCDMILNSDKEYIAEIKFGITTDTQDVFGNILSERKVSLESEKIKEAVMAFEGKISQLPPMYSAVKIGGKKLYEYARKGVEVERKPREVEIKKITLLNSDKDTAKIRVLCSKGTYIRTLCSDIGEYLNCGACMTSLVRTKSAGFDIENAYTLEYLEKNGFESCLLKTDTVFMDLPSLKVDDEIKTRLINGAKSTIKANSGLYRVYDMNESFVCVGKVFEYNGRNVVVSEKLFYEEL